MSMRILVVDDDETLRLTLRLVLESEGHEVDEAADGLAALALVASPKHYHAAILDVNMPRLQGLDTLQKIKDHHPSLCCLVLTAHSQVKDAVKAIKLGAYDYLEKPLDTEHLLALLAAAREADSLVEAAAFSAPHFPPSFAGELAGEPRDVLPCDAERSLIGGSTAIKKIYEMIYKLAKVETAVLVRGESGTGKELVARALHYNSQRKRGPFVALNCAAIPEALIESELFGYEKGAFTGAEKRKIGKFQYAQGGTLFLDEIGDISSSMQVRLLRVLQEKEYTPVGSNKEIKTDVRIVAATNRPLEALIAEGKFRADLFYRLNILPINLPPLRARPSDVPMLVSYMLEKFNKKHQRSIQAIAPAALNYLSLYQWPGNIRELENVIEHAFILENSATIQVGSLPEELVAAVKKQDPNREALAPGRASEPALEAEKGGLNYPLLKEQFERDFLLKALKAYDGRVNKTAEYTKMTKVTLLRKLEKYHIDPKDFHRH